MEQKQILYFDMDGVLADIAGGIDRLSESEKKRCAGRLDEIPGLFSLVRPVRGAKKAVEILSEYYDVRAISTAPWNRPSVWIDKLEWIKRHFGETFRDKLTLTTDKSRVFGYALIDNDINDRSGSGRFLGRIIWLKLPGKYGHCESRYEDKAEECRSWYDVCQRLITARSGDETWKQYENELWYE